MDVCQEVSEAQNVNVIYSAESEQPLEACRPVLRRWRQLIVGAQSAGTVSHGLASCEIWRLVCTIFGLYLDEAKIWDEWLDGSATHPSSYNGNDRIDRILGASCLVTASSRFGFSIRSPVMAGDKLAHHRRVLRARHHSTMRSHNGQQKRACSLHRHCNM